MAGEYRATVAVTYVNAHASPKVNYNSKNRKLRDEVVLSDVTIVTFQKTIDDPITLADVHTMLVTKGLVETVSLAETLEITFNGLHIVVIIPTNQLNGMPLNTHTLN